MVNAAWETKLLCVRAYVREFEPGKGEERKISQFSYVVIISQNWLHRFYSNWLQSKYIYIHVIFTFHNKSAIRFLDYSFSLLNILIESLPNVKFRISLVAPRWEQWLSMLGSCFLCTWRRHITALLDIYTYIYIHIYIYTGWFKTTWCLWNMIFLNEF